MESPGDEAAGARSGAPAPGSTLGPTCWSAYFDDSGPNRQPHGRHCGRRWRSWHGRETWAVSRAIRRRSSCTRWPQSSQRELTKVTCGIYCGDGSRVAALSLCVRCACAVCSSVRVRVPSFRCHAVRALSVCGSILIGGPTPLLPGPLSPPRSLWGGACVWARGPCPCVSVFSQWILCEACAALACRAPGAAEPEKTPRCLYLYIYSRYNSLYLILIIPIPIIHNTYTI